MGMPRGEQTRFYNLDQHNTLIAQLRLSSCTPPTVNFEPQLGQPKQNPKHSTPKTAVREQLPSKTGRPPYLVTRRECGYQGLVSSAAERQHSVTDARTGYVVVQCSQQLRLERSREAKGGQGYDVTAT